MADFVKKNWQCDDVITADDLNRLEGGVEEALDCCGDKGYSCTEEWTLLTDESVTTVLEEGFSEAQAELVYSTKIDAETIRVTFNGVEYICEYSDDSEAYGAPYNEETDSTDWSTYPFAIYWNGEGSYINTENAGTYQVKIEELSIETDVTECFKAAALQATKEATENMIEATISPLVLLYTDSAHTTLSATFKTIQDAYLAGRSVLLDPVPATSKSYYSMVSLKLANYLSYTSGGEIVFGGETTQTFTAPTASDYPVLSQTQS